MTATALATTAERLGELHAPGALMVTGYFRLLPEDRLSQRYLLEARAAAAQALEGLTDPETPASRAAARDVGRLLEYLDDPARLPRSRGVAIFACEALDLLEAVPLPAVTRARVRIGPRFAVRELAAVQLDFGNVIAAVVERAHARFFDVTAFSAAELPGVASPATRGGKYHSDRQDSPGWGEAGFHGRIREERHRHYDAVARHLLALQGPGTSRPLFLAGPGNVAAALLRFLPPAATGRVIGTARMNPTEVTAAAIHAAAVVLFNQAQVLAMVTGALFLVIGLATRSLYVRAMAADAATAELATSYLNWFVPAMALQFGLVAMGSALRAIGNFKTGMQVGTVTVILNMIVAPFLIFGWGTGRPLGVAGAAIASLIAIVVGLAWLTLYFLKAGTFLRFDPGAWRPRLVVWRRMLGIGLPAGAEFGITTVYLGLVYALTRPFGAAAQAGFSIGQRIIMAGFMPVVALGFSVAPVAGQNFGARLAQRVKDTFKDAAWMATATMIVFAILCHLVPGPLMRVFSADPTVIAVGTEYLRIISFNYVASGLIFVGSSVFQAMGNTLPSLLASVSRILLVAIPGVILSRVPGFQLHWLWWLSVASVLVQLALAMVLLRREFDRRLAWTVTPLPSVTDA